jgi:tRNA threonylcarbamoyladenosine biosynthesis protein TsaB
MRCILAIDTAGPEGSVALVADGRLLGAAPLPEAGHSEALSGAAARLLLDSGLTLRDLAAIAVAEGPGSFTGLRIGLAWAKGAAWGAGIPLVLVPSHESLATAHAAPGRVVASLIPGERGRVEAALWSGRLPKLLWGPESIDEDEVVERLLEQTGGAPLLLAPLTPKIAAAISDQSEEAEALLAPRVPLAPAVATIAERLLDAGRRASLIAAAPAYGRAPNARKPKQ